MVDRKRPRIAALITCYISVLFVQTSTCSRWG
jgi:hypothetical protein